jgi:hypothetical protein
MKTVNVVTAVIYLGLAMAAAGGFLLATLRGDFSWVARGGGAAWVFGLSLILLMPVVTTGVKRRVSGNGGGR